MTEIKIGTGGWAYFNIPGDKLFYYSRTFDMVEVNSTFYEYPNLDLVKSWRGRTPQSFEFTVRCHRDLSHRYQLQPIDAAFQVFSRMIHICKTLKAEIMQIQTPASLEFSSNRVKAIEQFLLSVDMKKVRITWEIQSRRNKPINKKVYEIMQNHNIIHCIDISKGEVPAYTSDILYTRLFGKGTHNIYQYVDKELREINSKAKKSGVKKAILNFHTIRNYKDAARLKVFRQTGRFPNVTRSLGIASLLEVLQQDTEFPITKSDLLKDQGWKIFDWKETQRQRLSYVIEKLPERTYYSLQDLAQILSSKSRL